ncbi:MAG: UDP-N-acetylmuramoyl-tripeptide--D-alanyl-D-alanine ligase [Oscillospiraceae bacterium]|nr:UDP-N-acetylmuramoyl-tripeptide--D-alanyl-D-alanine ligase [Oscillospiraceae bacterium]
MKMKPLTLAQATAAMDGVLIGGVENALIQQVVMDSRLDVAGALFLAIPGNRVDGHDFVADVLARGAVCALVEREIEDAPGAQIIVPCTQTAIKALARYYRALFDIPVIGITGSVGKTSTKEMMASVLGAKFNVHKTAGNLNNELGVPLTLLGLREEHEVAVIEMGISDFGEMTRLTDMVQPTVAIITIIGYAHLDNLGDRAGVFRAKTEIFHGIMPGGIALLNGDDDMLHSCKVTDIAPDKTNVKTVLYGLLPQNAYHVENIENQGEAGTSCDLCWNDMRLPVAIPVFGTPMVYAALASTAVGVRLGMTPTEIARGITDFQAVQGRSNVCKSTKFTIIDDCYNANPSSVKASVTALSTLPGRRVAILGDMGELGPDENALHYQTGEHISECDVDALICIGTSSRHIYDGAKAKKPTLTAMHFAEKSQAIAALNDFLQDGDHILVKASRFMRFEEIVEVLLAQR